MKSPGRAGSVAPGARRRLLLLLLAVVLPLLALSAWNLRRELYDREAQFAIERKALARVAAEAVDGIVLNDISALGTLALVPAVRDPSLGRLDQVLTDVAAASLDLEQVALVDSQGWTIAGSSAPSGINIGDRPYFRDALRTGKPVISNVLIGRASGEPSVPVTVPIDFVDGTRGVLIGLLSLPHLTQQLQALLPDPRLTVVVVDSEGVPLLHPDPQLVAHSSLRGRPDVDAALAGEGGTAEVADPAAGDIFVAFAPVRTAGWGVLVQQPAQAAFASTREDMAASAGLSGLVLLFVLGFGWVASGRLARSYADLEESLRQRDAVMSELQQTTQARNDFIAAVAHDLKTHSPRSPPPPSCFSV